MDIATFIETWRRSGASERANFQAFVYEFCDLLELPRPDPATPNELENTYVFDKRVPRHHDNRPDTTGFIDLYRRGSFVMEAKQGSEGGDDTPLFGLVGTRGRSGHGTRGTNPWNTALQKAKNQAERYVRDLPAVEGRPPFIVVVDVGYSFDLYSEFTRTGGSYIPYPDPQSHRVLLEDLHDEAVRERLRSLWLDPLSLDPSRRSEQVTKEIAKRLAILARSFEADGHDPNVVAGFLMRLIFTMFAEDVGLLPAQSIRGLFERLQGNSEHFGDYVQGLWETMNEGGFSTILDVTLAKFNGGLFQDTTALPVSEEALEVLIEAASADWREVEPAIFGTLLERALDSKERHTLGAHFTPRAYVERLVRPVLIEPLRSEWRDVHAAVVQLSLKGDVKEAREEVARFHAKLCSYKVLDPACGTGNFLYVSLELMKRLEAEVLELIGELQPGDEDRGALALLAASQNGDREGEQAPLAMQGATVSPEQFLGLELNPRAVKIAELVLWLGYLQWHFRTRGDEPLREPILRDFHNIKFQDAILECDSREINDAGRVVSCVNPRKATWPKADVVVGNPPFLWYSKMRDAMGDDYVDALQEAWRDVPKKSDNVMKWWHHAANLLKANEIDRFGFITTNSIRQSSNGKIVAKHIHHKKNPISIVYAIPDHPWVDEDTDDANVRISMTVCEAGQVEGTLDVVTNEVQSNDHVNVDRVVAMKRHQGDVFSDLTVGVDVTQAKRLQANDNLSAVGFKTIGPRGKDGYAIPAERATEMGLERRQGLERHLKPFKNWSDQTGKDRELLLLDFYGLSEEQVRQDFPEAYQYLLDEVWEFRSQHGNDNFREEWWVIGHPRPIFREYTADLTRYIATGETSKHRIFVFLPTTVAPESSLVTIGLDDAYFLGVLSSHAHEQWALRSGGWQGVGNDPRYFHTKCFITFPFPDATDDQRQRIRKLAEELHERRTDALERHPTLELTQLYNVVQKIRANEQLTKDEKRIRDTGLATLIAHLHDKIDTAVMEAYGFDDDPTNEELLRDLLALNQQRAQEEDQGYVRYLRPAFQSPEGVAQPTKVLEPEEAPTPTRKKQPWPKALPARARAIRSLIEQSEDPLSPKQVARAFHRGQENQARELLDTLTELGQLERLDDGRYAH